MDQEVIITIAPDGTTKIEANGVVGSSCSLLTKGIENAMGTKIADQKKPEYYEEATVERERHTHNA